MVRAIVARAGVSFAVVAFCMAVCAIAAWLAVGLPGTRFLTADTHSALAADYGPDQHVFSLPPLDTAIIEAAQNDLGVASQVVPPGDQARLLPSLPTPSPNDAFPPNAPTQTPKPGELAIPPASRRNPAR